MSHRLSYENGVEIGYARGLDAAREAVAGLEHYRVMESDPGLEKGRYDDPDPFLAGYLIYADDALAAIDALRRRK